MGCKPTQVTKEIVKTVKDTVLLKTVKIDTVKQIIGDTVYITVIKEVEKEKVKVETVTNTVYEKCNDKTERVKARLDYKAERDSLETILKLERQKSKQQKYSGQQAIKEKRIENRSRWFLWLCIGFILCIASIYGLSKLLK